jgi:hypothetical protein
MVWQPEDPPPREQGSRKIQLPYINRFKTIWEYEKAFLTEQIDFFSCIEPACPICGTHHCYRKITPYWRYAIELFPCFRKKLIPIARFRCRSTLRTFSLLPIQLIPYFQYTVVAVIGTLLLGYHYWQSGQQGFFGAMNEVDPDSDVTPWLIVCWLEVVLRGFRRAHPVLGRFYDLSGVHTSERRLSWEEVTGYFLAFGWKPDIPFVPLLLKLLHLYNQQAGYFLFGTASQHRLQNPC